MVRVNEAPNILNNTTDRSLIILDEIGRDTSTYDGLSIAWAVVEHLDRAPERGPRTLLATRHHELTQLAKPCSPACRDQLRQGISEKYRRANLELRKSGSSITARCLRPAIRSFFPAFLISRFVFQRRSCRSGCTTQTAP